METVVERGNWDENISWELHEADVLPPEELCSAVFCMGILAEKIILMRAKRGWGLVGGHIEPGETLLDALNHEAMAEAGFIPESPTLFGYRKITAKEPVAHQDPSKDYPFPVSYILYYVAKTSACSFEPSEPDSLEAKAFTLDDIRELGTPDLNIIELGWRVHTSTTQTKNILS